MVSDLNIEELCASQRDTLQAQYELMRQSDVWSLSCPSIVIDGRKTDSQATPITVGTINSVLTTSQEADNPVIRQWMALITDVGVDGAFEAMLYGADGEEFARAHEALRVERQERGVAIWTMEDSTAFVMRSKEAFERQEMSCVALLPPTSNSDATPMCATFCWRPNR